MKKILIISIIFILCGSGLAQALVLDDFVNNQAPSAYFYPQEFDKLVMDLTISSVIDGTDKLSAITIKNTGTTKNRDDIEKFKLWKDADEPGFQGMGKDKELGTFTYYASDISWYLSGLEESVPAEGLRIFISAEIAKNPTSNRSLQIQIPSLSDKNNNGIFDLGDLGIFMESKNNGLIDEAIVNSYSQTIRDFVIDNLAPKTVITDPEDNSIITTESYFIKGVSRDQGGSTPSWVKISINDGDWQEVEAIGSNYSTWQYLWQNYTEGVFTIKTQSEDWIGNRETIGDEITVSVDFPEEPGEEEEPEEEAEEEIIEEEVTEEEKLISEMTEQELKAKIIEVQQKIIELLKQLIQLIQSELI